MRSFSFVFLLILCLVCVHGYKILGIFHLPTFSQFKIIDKIMLELARRGHKITSYTPFPIKTDLRPANYYEVDISECFPAFNRTESGYSNITVLEGFWGYKFQTKLFLSIWPEESLILGCQKLLDLRDSTNSFDVVIAQSSICNFFNSFGLRFNAPVILIRGASITPWLSETFGMPYPIYESDSFTNQNQGTSFKDRFWNSIMNIYVLLLYKFRAENIYEKTRKEFFGTTKPPLNEIQKNVSLLLVNTHFSLHSPRPVVPAVVEVGGLHIGNPEPLPQDIEKFINESTDGVIYFCMGSLTRGESMPDEKRNAFLHAFSKIPQRVLWKWEGGILPGKTDDIMISKWLPQRDILAHPNIKLFISHGGISGTIEAVHEGVPILGIPVFADQIFNIKTVEARGIGELLYYDDISEKVVLDKIQRLINDTKYKQNAIDLSKKFRDRPMTPLNTAIYWIEYVIRHKGAHHLKTNVVNMPLYQYLSLDVVAGLIFGLFSVLLIIYYFTTFMLKLYLYSFSVSKKEMHVATLKKKKQR